MGTRTSNRLESAINLLALAEVLTGVGALIGAIVLAQDPNWGMATLFLVLLLPLSLLIGTGIILFFRHPVSYLIHVLAFPVLTLGAACLFGAVVGFRNFVTEILLAGAIVVPVEVWLLSRPVKKLFRVVD
jgi:hypothetical protein